MRRLTLGTVIAALLATTPAAAELLPVPGPFDPRVRQVVWMPEEVVQVDTRLRSITAIELGEGETISAILAGDSESFEIVRLKSANVFSLKPLVRKARTNIVVYTDRRAYSFDVTEQRREPASRIRFLYPQDEKAKAEAEAALVVPGPGPNGSDDYSAAGVADFRPVEMWDDGTNTYLRFAPGARRPAVFATTPGGTDHVANTTQLDRDTVKVFGLHPRWTLRIGPETVCIVRGAVPPALEAQVAAQVASQNRGDDLRPRAPVIEESDDDQ